MRMNLVKCVSESTTVRNLITLLMVKWFKTAKRNLGTIEAAWGVVKEIDGNRKRFNLVCVWEAHWINIEDLVSVTK